MRIEATIDQSPYSWIRHYSGTVQVDNQVYGYAVVTTETEQTAEYITEIVWENGDYKPDAEGSAVAEIQETWTEQHYAHYKREDQ
jgi:hypothetical protein